MADSQQLVNGFGHPWVVQGSKESVACINPVRGVVEDDFKEALSRQNPALDLIDTSTGDPTRFGTLPVHEAVTESLVRVVQSNDYNGYGPSNGLPKTREAVAKFFNRPSAPLTAEVSVHSIISHSASTR